MPQDTDKKHQYEQEARQHKTAREDAQTDAQVNEAALGADSHTGQQGLMRQDSEGVEGDHVKKLYALLPDWHKDELRRLTVVPQGTRLKQGGVYADLRNPTAGELVAHGEEEVHDELLVAKHGTDYEIWNKLLGKSQ